MHQLLLLLTITCTSVVIGHAGTVSFLPMQPRQGAPVAVEYTPDVADADLVTGKPSPLHAVVYTFTEEAEAPVAHDVLLRKDGNRYTGSWTVPANVVFFLTKVGNGSRYDTNGDQLWSAVVQNSTGKVVRGAHLREAMSWLGQLPLQCRRKQDFDEAAEAIERELRAYPNNLVAQVNSIMFRGNAGQIDQQEASAQLRSIVSGKPTANSPMEFIALALAWELLQDSANVVRTKVDGANRFPNSILQEQNSLEKLKDAPNAQAYIQATVSHLKTYPSSAARANLVESVFNVAARAREIHLLVPFIETLPSPTASDYHMAVNYLGANDTLRKVAYDFLQRGLKAAENPSLRPTSFGTYEWLSNQRRMTAALHFVHGAILRADKRNSEALTALERSVAVGEDETDKETWQMMVELQRETGNAKAALSTAEKAIRLGAATAKTLEAYRELRALSGTDSATIEKDLATIKMQGRKALSHRLVKDMLNLPPIDGTFMTVDGQPVPLSSLRGKVVVVDYWATWCGPCRASFPSLQKLYEQYRSNPNVAIAVVNVWERTKDRVKTVKDFLMSNPTLQFPVYLDPTDSVVAKYGVTGIPTKFYLGKDGRIQFKEVGYLPEEQFLEEATNKIEVLLAQ
jgi:thiol-disulfide isomerase/thioredoxin